MAPKLRVLYSALTNAIRSDRGSGCLGIALGESHHWHCASIGNQTSALGSRIDQPLSCARELGYGDVLARYVVCLLSRL